MAAASLVVALRMPFSAIGFGPERTYLARARPMRARGEALGARLIAWSANLLAMAWDLDGAEEAFELACSVRTEGSSPEDAWACGIAEGELELLSLEDVRPHLAWGEALLVATSLARIAQPGEVLVDGDVTVVRNGTLALAGGRSASDGGRRVRGWRLNLERPWRTAAPPEGHGASALPLEDEELSSADVLELTEWAQAAPSSLPVESESDGPVPPEAAKGQLAGLQGEPRNADRGPPSARCRASLALAMTLASASRPQDALVEALAALARAREDGDPKALAACYALLAKLYAIAGKGDASEELRALATRAGGLGP